MLAKLQKSTNSGLLITCNILKKYESVNIVSIMQCAGNRAAEDIKATGKTGFVGTPFEFIEGGMVGNVQCM